MTKRYYWLRLKNDFFKSKAMKKLRRIAGGDTYTIIYLKLMLLSLMDEGRLYFEGIEPTFYEEMALALDEDSENVQATLLFLESAGLIRQESEECYLLIEVPELIGSETDKAEIMRRKRKRDRLENGNNVTEALPEVTNCYTEIEIDKDIDIEKEKKRENTRVFVKPTLEEVEQYCFERGNNVDPGEFIDFYESKGWMIGKNKMKDWKAAVRTWERNHKNKKAEELDEFYDFMDKWQKGED